MIADITGGIATMIEGIPHGLVKSGSCLSYRVGLRG